MNTKKLEKLNSKKLNMSSVTGGLMAVNIATAGFTTVYEFPGWQIWSDVTGDHDCTNNGTDCTDANSPTDAIRDSSGPTLPSSDGCQF